MIEPKHTCETCVYERDSSPSQHCDGCVDEDNWRAKEPLNCPCKGYEMLVELLRYFYELPSKGVRNQAEHNTKLKEAEQALAGETK